MSVSKFSSLPPELIVEVSDYLDGCDLYDAFYNLNGRINQILDDQCHRLHVNFSQISKTKFDLFCHRILPRIGKRVVSLTLNGDRSSTPGQLKLFLSHFRSLSNSFSKLESLKLINSTKFDVENVLAHLPSLNVLQRLSIGGYKPLMPFAVETSQLFSERVLLPVSLRHLAFPFEISSQWISTSNLSMPSLEKFHAHLIHVDAVAHLLQGCPSLKCLNAILDNNTEIISPIDNHLTTEVMFHGLRSLNVNITTSVRFESFASLLAHLPELDSLSIESVNPQLPFLDAHRWENVLPCQIVSFRFDLAMRAENNSNHLELFESFRSQFWSSRGWFVQCHLRDNDRFFRLSTIRSPTISNLYWPDDEILVGSTERIVYPNVRHLELWWNLSKPIRAQCPQLESIHCYGIENNVDEPIHSEICEILQTRSLKHLIIDNNSPLKAIRFACLLAKSSSNVDCLTCSSDWLLAILRERQYEWICLMLTKRIRRLNLIDDDFLLANTDLISFCRTFVNLNELTMKLDLIEDFLLLLNTLTQLTMIKIELPLQILLEIVEINSWIRQNTVLLDFHAEREIFPSNHCHLTLWIGSRTTAENLFLKHPFIHLRVARNS